METMTGKNPVSNKPPKSEEMTPAEMAFIENHVGKFTTEVAAATSLGVDRGVLGPLLLKYQAGKTASCRPDKAAIIREHIKDLGFVSHQTNSGNE